LVSALDLPAEVTGPCVNARKAAACALAWEKSAPDFRKKQVVRSPKVSFIFVRLFTTKYQEERERLRASAGSEK